MQTTNTTWRQELSPRRLWQNAAVMNLSLGAIILGSLYQNPEIWLQDYPQPIQERFGPKSQEATRLTKLWAIPFFVVLFGGVFVANRRLRRSNGGRLSLKAAFANAYLLFLSFWAFDLTIIDWLIMMGLKPSFAILPGTEDMAEYNDAMFHLRESWPFIFVMAIPSAIIAVLTASSGNK